LNDSKKANVLKALASLSKFLGCYESFKQQHWDFGLTSRGKSGDFIMGGGGSQQWVQQQVLLKQAPVQKPHEKRECRHRLGLGSSVSWRMRVCHRVLRACLPYVGAYRHRRGGFMTWDADSEFTLNLVKTVLNWHL